MKSPDRCGTGTAPPPGAAPGRGAGAPPGSPSAHDNGADAGIPSARVGRAPGGSSELSPEWLDDWGTLPVPLAISVRQLQGFTVLSVAGEIDIATAPQLQATL